MIPNPTSGVSVDVKTDDDWTRKVSPAPAKSAKYPVGEFYFHEYYHNQFRVLNTLKTKQWFDMN